MRRVIVSAALLALLGASAAAWAQGSRTGLGPDPIEQSRELSQRPLPRLPAAPAPSERWVPERRVRLPETGREVVVPGHWERRVSDQQVMVPPLTARGAAGEGPIHIPGGERLPADLRQAP